MLARQKMLKSPGQTQPFISTANPIQNPITLVIGFLTRPWHGYWPHGLIAGIGMRIEKMMLQKKQITNNLHRIFNMVMKKNQLKVEWMRKIRFANIYLFTLAAMFFVLGAFIESETIASINRINAKSLDYPEYLHLIFFFGGFLALCSMYFSEKMEATILSSANRGLQKEMDERKRMEKALMESKEEYRELYAESKRSEEVYRSLLHSSADAIVIYDMKGNVRYISPAFSRIFGWNLADVEGKKIPFLPESERESTRGMIRDLVEKGKACHGFETTRYTRNRHLIDVSISASRYNDHDGQPAGKLFILRDISEKKKLESQLKFIERMETIGTLAGGIAHDFNNLMMGMLGNISLLLYEIDATHPHCEKLKNIEKLIESGSKLTSQLLGFARKGRYEVRPINLNKVVQETSVTFGRTRKDITIHRKLSEDLFSIKVDEHQIEQVLMNLYINAADAMPDGGDLFLKTLKVTHKEIKDKPYNPKPGQYILLNVIDNGTGMDEKTAERIFEPFFTTKEMGRGTGLGLASAYGIIKGHGGYIDVDSKKEQGTNFSIYLPASDEPIHQTTEISKQILAGNETILIVDDEEIVIDVGVELLNKLGHTVLKAMNGCEAIEVFKENKDKIDLVILDMIMPDIGGGETYDNLKKIDSEIKVLLASGYSLSGQASEILDRGCNGFIQKPFNMRTLSQKIREVLSDDKFRSIQV